MRIFLNRNINLGIFADNKFFNYCLLIGCALLTTTPYSQNLVQNSSFETGDNSWLSKGENMEGHHQSILGVTPVEGEYYAELANDKGYKLLQKVSVEPGKYYQVSMIGYVEVNELKQPSFISIFDGKTLDGWNVYGNSSDLEKKYWTVDNESILCNTMGDKNHGAVWLFYEEELTDFELKIKFQAYRDSPGNSGLQVRSRFYEGGDIDGPQFDIHPPAPFRTALLYDESDGYNRWIYPNMPSPALKPEQANNKSAFYYADDSPSWNELHVICKGTYIKSILNGVVVTDFDGAGILDDVIHQEQNVGITGKIALQVHAKNELKIRFKDIQLKKLN